MENELLLSLFKEINPEEVIFWTGAGISMQSPTNLPGGADLTKLCIDTFMPEGTLNLVKSLFYLGKFKDSFGNRKKLPRLELIIEDIIGVLGFEAFKYFCFMDIPEQYLNLYHLFFAKHITKGGHNFTMNLDNGIEKILLCLIDRIVKLHGTITDKSSYKNLGLLLKNIVNGFNNKLAQNIHNVLISSKIKILCFIGYGGVDSFDVIPFFKALVNNIRKDSLKNLTVIWIVHREQDIFESIKLSNVGNGGPIILDGLMKLGANTHPFKGNAIKLIELLANIWGWNLQKLQSINTYNWKEIFDKELIKHPISEEIKNLIAGQYMAALGVGQWAVYFCNPSIPPLSLSSNKDPEKGFFTSQINQWWRVYTNGLRDWGKYKEAIKKIKEWKSSVHSPFDIFVTLLRLMGEYRLTGRFIKSFKIYRKALKMINRNNWESTENPDELFTLSEFWITYLHIHSDLWQLFPKFRKRLLFLWRNVVSKAWVDAFLLYQKRAWPRGWSQLIGLAEDFKELEYFIHQAKLRDSSISIDIKKYSMASDTTNFIETDGLLSDINYQRKHVIDKMEEQPLIIDNLKDNLLKAQTIQDLPGIFKAYYRLSKEYLTKGDSIITYKNAKMALDIMSKIEYSIFYRIHYKCRLCKILIKSRSSQR